MMALFFAEMCIRDSILSLHSFQTERTFDQLSLVVQQPLTTDNDLTIIATVKLRDGNIERVLGLSLIHI